MKRILLFLMMAVLLVGCTQKVSYTEVLISDPIRHYYPILQGQELTVTIRVTNLQGQHLRIVARVTNMGNVPLVIRDIQPSCGCIIVNVKREVIVPPGRFMYLTLDYDSKKNVGKVEHAVRIWGNISPKGMAEMRFDINVVPDANYQHDYEELYERDKPTEKSLKDIVQGMGRETGLGYYVER